MSASEWKKLRRACLAVFAVGALLILFWIMLEALYIKRLTVESLFPISFPATVILLAGLVVSLQMYTNARIGRKLRYTGRLGGDDAAAKHEEDIAGRLLGLPAGLVRVTVRYALVLIPLYTISHYILRGMPFPNVPSFYRLAFLRSFLYELAVVISVAVLYYVVVRRLIRPALAAMTKWNGRHLRGRSFFGMIAMTFTALLLVVMFTILWFVVVAHIREEPVHLDILGAIVALQLMFASAVFVMLAMSFRGELQVLVSRLSELPAAARAGSESSRIPILSDDEVGRLAAAFNRLHDRIHREYELLAEELRLARQLQLQLLPEACQTIGALDIAAFSEPRTEVGSGFYDVIVREDGAAVVIAGEVSGQGMPAALQMSAFLLLLRAEAGSGSPREMIGRFEQSATAVFPEEAGVAVAIAVIDAARGTFRAAYTGGMKVADLPGDTGALPAFAGADAGKADAATAKKAVAGSGAVEPAAAKSSEVWRTETVSAETRHMELRHTETGYAEIGFTEGRLGERDALCLLSSSAASALGQLRSAEAGLLLSGLVAQRPLEEQLAQAVASFRESAAPDSDFTIVLIRRREERQGGGVA